MHNWPIWNVFRFAIPGVTSSGPDLPVGALAGAKHASLKSPARPKTRPETLSAADYARLSA